MSNGISGVPLRDLAPPLRDAWLNFHRANLCLGVDAVFVCQPKGLEVWCRIKDERNYQQLCALLEPLQGNFQIDIYPTRIDREKKSYDPDEDNPPPSFWTNGELRAYMHDPSFSRPGAMDNADAASLIRANADPELKRRLRMFRDDILEPLIKMECLAGDVPALAGAAFAADLAPEFCARARSVCFAHTREAGKCAGRLAETLSHAMPRGSGKGDGGNKPGPQEPAVTLAPAEYAVKIFSQARLLAQRVRNFMYPQAHTVDLENLRAPGIIEALKNLQKFSAAFENSAPRAR